MLAPRERLWSTPEEVVAEAARLLALTPQDVVYDVGAGDGRVLLHFASLASPPRQVVGVEIHKDRAQSVASMIASRGLQERCTVIIANALELSYDDATAVFLYLVPRYFNSSTHCP